MRLLSFLLLTLCLSCAADTDGDGSNIDEAVTSQPAPGIATNEPEENTPPDLTNAAVTAANGGTLSGMYVYFADSALFIECATKRRYPVAAERAGIELERAYTSIEQDQPNPVFVRVRGSIEDRRGQVEGPLKDVLVVTELLAFERETDCADR